MKICIVRHTIVAMLCWLLLSCNNDRQVRHENNKLMEQAERLTENQPDVALILLDSVNTALMNEAQYAGFLLLRTRARDMAGVDISVDTAIYIAKRYFAKQGDTEKAAWANYYLGRIYLMRRDYDKALPAFNESGRMAGLSANNIYLKGLTQYYLGELYYSNNDCKSASASCKRAATYFHAAGKIANEAGAYALAGNAFLLCKQTDSALLYHNRAVTLAETISDSTINTGALMLNAGVALLHHEEPGKAKEMFFRAMQQQNDHVRQTKIYLNLVATCLQMNQTDSAIYYRKKASGLLGQDLDLETLAYACYVFMDVEKEQGNWRKALEYFEQYDQYAGDASTETENYDLAGEQRRYDAGLAQTERDRERMSIQENRIARMTLAITVLICLALACALGFLVWHLLKAQRTIRTLRKQEGGFMKHIEQLNAQLAIARSEEERLALLRQIADKEDSLYSCFRPALLDRYNTMRKERRQKTIAEGKQKNSEWDSFEQLMPKVLMDTIKQKYGLQNALVKICCLLYFDFKNIEIAEILGQTSGSVNVSISSRIRTKLVIEVGGDVGLFLRHNLWVSPHPEGEPQ